MAVDLGDLIDPLKREISPPGGDLYPDADDDTYVGFLADGFWEAFLDGLLTAYEEADGEVTPRTDGADDMSRDLQQIIVIYAGMKVTRSALQNNQTLFRAKAGPVEFETQSSATILKALLDELRDRRDRLIDNLSQAGVLGGVYIDGVSARGESIGSGDIWWVR